MCHTPTHDPLVYLCMPNPQNQPYRLCFWFHRTINNNVFEPNVRMKTFFFGWRDENDFGWAWLTAELCLSLVLCICWHVVWRFLRRACAFLYSIGTDCACQTKFWQNCHFEQLLVDRTWASCSHANGDFAKKEKEKKDENASVHIVALYTPISINHEIRIKITGFDNHLWWMDE